jgi:hypothetical protein
MSKLYPRKDIPAFLARQPINPIREPKLHRNVVVPPLDPDKIEASAEKVDDDWYGNLANGRLDKHTRAQVLAVVVVVVVVVGGGGADVLGCQISSGVCKLVARDRVDRGFRMGCFINYTATTLALFLSQLSRTL